MTSQGPQDLVTDAQLLQRHAAGDGDAFGELYGRHRDRMWRVAVGVCGDHELAADGVQEGFIAAFRRAGSYRGDAAVTTWLHRIVVNACIDVLRRRRPTVELTRAEAASAPSEVDRVDTRLAVHAALRQLPLEQRLALVLVDMHGFPVAEAASVLEVAEGTIKSRCARGRAALAVLLSETDDADEGTTRPITTSDTSGPTDEGRWP